MIQYFTVHTKTFMIKKLKLKTTTTTTLAIKNGK